MKRIFILSLAMIFATSLFAQKGLTKSPIKTSHAYAMMHQKALDGTETIIPGENTGSIVQTPKGTLLDAELLTTVYDLQGNSYPTNRAYRTADGKIGFTATISEEESHANRGTAYNFYNGTTWNNMVMERNVESVRTGWPTLVPYGNGEILLSHTGTVTNCYRRDVRGQGDWQLVSTLPYSGATTYSWPRAGVSVGDDGTEYLHAIASYQYSVTSDSTNTQLKYFRSSDGGNTWGISEFEIPGFDFATHHNLNSDYTTITTNGSIVVILLINHGEDAMYVRSEDNGNTWSHHFIYQNWFSELGYEYAGIPMASDDTIVLWCPSAGTGVLDNDGVLHVVINTGSISRYGDGSWYSYGAGIDGISYWNETMGQIQRDPSFVNNLGNHLATTDSTFHMYAMDRNEAITIIGALGGSWYGVFDEDAENWPIFESYSNDNCHFYRTYGLSTMPTISVDKFGRRLVTYSTFTKEGDIDGNGQYFRRIFARQYNPETEEWQEETTNVTSDFTYGYSEIIYPVVPDYNVDGDVWHIFHTSDPLVGLLLDSDHTASDNIYKHTTLVKDPYIPDQAINEINAVSFEMYPNPTNSNVYITLENTANIKIYNTVGQLVKVINNAQGKVGVDVSSFANGIYLVNVSNANGVSSAQKLIVK